MERDSVVRAISRGLAVLKTINQHASADMTAIAKGTGLPYATVCRVVETLIEEGMIEREPNRKHYRPTSLVQSLSQGYRPEDKLVEAADRFIHDLTRAVLWPISVSSRVGTSMIIRVSSHHISPKTLNIYHPGYTMPILGCSAGIVYLAFCSEAESESVLDGLDQAGALGGSFARRQIKRTFDEVRAQGYGLTERCQNNRNPGKTSSIAAPVMVADSCVGAVTLSVYSSVMSAKEAAEQYAETVCDLAQTISEKLDPAALACSVGRDMSLGLPSDGETAHCLTAPDRCKSRPRPSF